MENSLINSWYARELNDFTEVQRLLQGFRRRQKFRGVSNATEIQGQVKNTRLSHDVKVGKISELADTRRYLKVSRISETC